ncbi:hypothetical protein [Agrobacterium rubi]|uniref:hypothetical protein n=1 Tax=Agrobacterium rubi TaxID=28099 RepID=UPI001573BB5B|nr:hypothetical protein [Agrobacterium rubi]NTE87258.1 hypothetical protein [Agrobacterium rubi]NTF03192.1 hypothetical protein [Agrobacterium rubi]
MVTEKMIEAARSAVILGEDADGKPVYLSGLEARAALEAALSAVETVETMDEEDRTPMPAGLDPALWQKADEIHHAMALVAHDQECVKIIYAALSTDAEPVGEIAGQQGRYWIGIEGRWSNWFDITFNTWVPEPGVREVRNLYAQPPQIAPAVAVRALEWDDRGETIRDRFKAPSILGDYYVAREKSGLFSWRTYLLHGSIIVGNADEAKAAAQADYEARIRSALSAQVQSKPDDHVWIKCPNGHGETTHAHFDFCACCPKCGAVMENCDAAPPAPSVAMKALQKIAALKTSAEIGQATLIANDIEGSHDAMILEARSALSAQVQDVAEWQDISTAPKDVAEHFVQPTLIGSVKWGDGSRHVGPIIFYSQTGWEFIEVDYDMFPSPTHWMPFPAAAPAAKQGEAE